jgi:endonuclease/exonuclease/phosphatase family metal-dependent hydrolase
VSALLGIESSTLDLLEVASFLSLVQVPQCIDFILTAEEIKAEDTEVLFTGRQVLRGGTGYVSDHLGLLARLNCLGA